MGRCSVDLGLEFGGGLGSALLARSSALGLGRIGHHGVSDGQLLWAVLVGWLATADSGWTGQFNHRV